MDYSDLFEPYDKLIDLEICGKHYEVPENNMLLRCFQYISMDTVSMGDFCWNGDCANCQVWFEATDGGKEKPALSCRTKVAEGMKIVRMAEEIDLGDGA